MSFSHSEFTCVSCGAPISFRAGASVFAVCKHCGSTLLKNGASLETLGKMAELKEDFSVLQLGSIGRCPEGPFSIIGRVRMTWAQGSWNEWLLLFDTNASGWLAEAQGWLAVSFEAKDVVIPETTLSPGAVLDLDGEQFTVQDLKEATCTFSEGELPFSGAVGEQQYVVDCVGTGNRFASIARTSAQTTVYIGQYYTFEQLRLEHLRTLDGW